MTVNNVGFGYTNTNPPKVVAPIPNQSQKKLLILKMFKGLVELSPQYQ